MTGNKRAIGSDLERVDTHVITPDEYAEIPEITEEMFQSADLYRGGKLIQRGRPKLANPKHQITLRLDTEVVDGFRETGPGWQGRINNALRQSLGLKAGKP